MLSLPTQVDRAKLKERIDATIEIASVELRKPDHYAYLPAIYDSLCHLSKLLDIQEECVDLGKLEYYATGAGALTIRDDGMPFSDSELGEAVLRCTGPLHRMYWIQNALSMITEIINRQPESTAAMEIRDVLIDFLGIFARDGSFKYEAVIPFHDRVRGIRTKYDGTLGPEYQRVFQEILG